MTVLRRAARRAVDRTVAAVILAVPILMGAAPGSGGERIEPAAYARLNAALVESHVLPRYARLAAATEALATAARDVCTSGGAAGRVRAQARFHDAMDAWMGVQHLRFGPVELFMRAHRFYFWPQARGKVAAAVREAVAAGDDAALLPSRIGHANVAVQGLLAAEILLYGGDPPGAEARPGSRGCGLLTAAAGNMRAMAADIVADWKEGAAPFAWLVANPGPENPYFLDHREVTLAFFQSLHDGLRLIADVKLKPVVGDAAPAARPRLAESRPSGRSLRNVIDNLEALQALYRGEGGPGRAGFGDLARAADPRLDRLLRKAFRFALATARSIDRPLEDAVTDSSLRPKAEKLALQVRALKQIVRDRLAPALALAVGFNALDGD